MSIDIIIFNVLVSESNLLQGDTVPLIPHFSWKDKENARAYHEFEISIKRACGPILHEEAQWQKQ